jgi:trans-aconitate 2-methyltransferase
MKWDTEQYEKFKREREQPFVDLVALIDKRENQRVIDLGCGTGELTEKLSQILPGSKVLGIDSSPEMLKKANVPTLQKTIEEFVEETDEYDLIFSHAALHWLPDHATLIPRLLKRTRQLAVQVPSNHFHRGARIMAEVAGWERQFPVLSIADYADLLWQSGGRNITCYEKVYCHELADADAIFEFMRGTAFLPYLEKAGDPQRLADEVRARFHREFPGSPVLFGMRRTLFYAQRV